MTNVHKYIKQPSEQLIVDKILCIEKPQQEDDRDNFCYFVSYRMSPNINFLPNFIICEVTLKIKFFSDCSLIR